MKNTSKVWLVVGSLAVGMLNGFFGGGGGMVCVPMLENGMNITNKQSHATAIAVILPISAVSALVWGKNTTADMNAVFWVGVGAFAGGIVGALLLNRFSSKWVRIVFSFVVLAAGIKVILG